MTADVGTSVRAAPAAWSGGGERTLALAAALFSLLCVSPLLAWVFGLGTFAAWFRFVAAPSLVALLALAVVAHRNPAFVRLRAGIALGAAGGLLGTILYDLARVPFVLLGMRLFAPIDSYGVLLTDAAASNPLTDFAGWAYHFANGICFGIAYGVLMQGRSKWFAVVWALVLESAAVVTPFADHYGLRANPMAIVIAYAAHVPYGLAVGYLVSQGSVMQAKLAEISARPVITALALLVVVLGLWLRPVLSLRSAPATEVRNGRFRPEMVRVAPGGCMELTNTDDRRFRIVDDRGDVDVAPSSASSLCFDRVGVHRVKTSDEPYSGGFVIVDQALAA